MVGKKKKAYLVNEPISGSYRISEKTEVFQFLEKAKNLSPTIINKIIKELVEMAKQNTIKANTEFSSFLLTGPVMSDTQFEEFKKQRENFNKWRLK